jgi:hypothetical protein
MAVAAMLFACLLLPSLACDSGSSGRPEASAGGEPLWDASASTVERAAIILALPDGVERIRRFAELLQASDVDDAPEIAEVFEFSVRDAGDVELAVFAEWWTHAEPETAYRWADDHWRSDSPRVVATVVRTWAREDPALAFEFGFRNRRLGGAPFFRDELIDAVIVGWVESGQPGVLDFIFSKMKDPSKLQRALRSLGRAKVVTLGVPGALEWATEANFTDPKARNYLVVNVASAAADQDPELVAEFIASKEAEGQPFPGVHRRIAARWARYEPLEAIQWIEGLEDEKEREHAIDGAAINWFLKDPRGAFEWYEAQDFEPWLEPMATQYFQARLRMAKPDFDWQALIEEHALPIQTDNIRWGVIALTLQRWSAQDADAVEAWLAANPDVLPERYAESVRTMTDRQRERMQKEAADNAASS